MAKKGAKAPEKKEAPEVTYTNGMDKIRDEMAKSKSNYVRVIGEYLTNYLLEHPEAEAAILTKGKNIAGSLYAMRQEAEKVKDGNVAVLDDATGFRIVREYFGIKEGETENGKETGGALSPAARVLPHSHGEAMGDAGETVDAGKTATEPDPFDLDALMGVTA